jgi:hypothetical protein
MLIKKSLLLPVLLLLVAVVNAQEYTLLKCTSGDCQNGSGEAVFTNNFLNAMTPTLYKGTFKNGKMDGEGTLSNNLEYYIGSFRNGEKYGYGILYKSKKVGGINQPDSMQWVSFCKWDEDGGMQSIQVHENGETGYFNTEGHDHKKNFRPYKEVKDKWINEHANAYMNSMSLVFAARKAAHDSAYPKPFELKTETNFIAVKSITVVRGKAATFISWDCLTDRDYFVSASGDTKDRQLPFGGYVTYQVLAEDNIVVFEGRADVYWKPRKEGRYTFIVKFDQGEISGNTDLYVDAVRLRCSLMTRRIL